MHLFIFLFLWVCTASPGYCGGKWTTSLTNEGIEKGNAYAAQKAESYRADSQLLKSFQAVIAQDYIILINKQLILEVVQNVFKKKHDKWVNRTNFSLDANPLSIVELDFSQVLKFAILQIERDAVNVYMKYPNIRDFANYFMHRQNDVFAQVHADSQLVNLSNFLYFMGPESSNHESFKTVMRVLMHLNTGKTLNQRRIFYNFLMCQQHKIMQDLDCNMAPIIKPVVYVIDSEFRGLNCGNFNIFQKNLADFIRPWNGGDFLDEHIPLGHGDCMGQIIAQFSGNADVRGWSSWDLINGNGPLLLEENIANNISSGPFLFNASLALMDLAVFWLNQDENGIKYDPENRNIIYLDRYKTIIESVLNGRNNNSPYLQAEEITQIRSACKDHNQKMNIADFSTMLVCIFKGLLSNCNEQKMILNLACSNLHGKLTKVQGFHNNFMPAFADPAIESHTIIGLNYDLSTATLVESSKQAGDYADRAVCCPSAFSAVLEPLTQMPFFHLGGHSTATAMVTAISARLWSYFPCLSHQEIQRSILLGARKDIIPNYDPLIYGQGMINFKGAFNVATHMALEKVMAQQAIVLQNFQMPQ